MMTFPYKEVTPEIFTQLALGIGFTLAEQHQAAMTLVREVYAEQDLIPRALPIAFEPGLIPIGSNVKRFFDGALTSAAMRNYYEPEFNICSDDTLNNLREMFTAARDYDQRGLVWELPRY